MTIEEYEFGRIVVDGRVETFDLIVTRSGVHPNWWRPGGHALTIEDLGAVLEDPPEVLVVGTGADRRMCPESGLAEALAGHGIELELMDTFAAVQRFNELLGVRNVAAALHLTC
jgi:hypothetical protein